MPKGYLIANIHPTGAPPPPPEYFAAFQEGLKRFGARRVITSNEIDHREGHMDIGRLLVLEYADKATAVAAYEAYVREVAPLNPNKPKRELFIVEGTE